MSARTPSRDVRVGSEPRVQLLPPMVRQKERTRRTRRMATFAVLVALAVTFGASAFAYIRTLQAQASLASAHDLTARILAEQGEYAEASSTARLIADTESARQIVTENEVEWTALVAALGTHVPAGASIATIGMHAPAPWEAPLAPEGELRADRVAVVDLTISGPDYASAAAFVTSVYGMEGVADAYITGTSFTDGAYRTSISIAFDSAIRTERFAPEPEDDDDDESTTSDAEGEQPGEAAP